MPGYRYCILVAGLMCFRIRQLTERLADYPLDLRFTGWHEIIMNKGRGTVDFAVISGMGTGAGLAKSVRSYLKVGGELVYVLGGVSAVEKMILAWMYGQRGRPPLFMVDENGFLRWSSRRPPLVTKANALQYSIAKWKFIAQWLKKGLYLREDGGSETCGLCLLYNHPEQKYGPGEACQGCPIRAYTGRQFCADTPYVLMRTYTVDEENPGLGVLNDVDAATAELNFLRKLAQGGKKGGRGQ